MEYMEYLGLPATLVACFAALQVIGKIMDAKGKVVPEIMAVWKYFKRKKQEREMFGEVQKTLTEVRAQLKEINAHYSADNIAMRDGWMQGVNKSLEENDKHFQELSKKLEQNSADTAEILIEHKRSEIISFAAFVSDEKCPHQVTREQFNRIFRIHGEYEEIIKKRKIKNGEVDIAIRIIRESYEEHTKKHSFIEDNRWND